MLTDRFAAASESERDFRDGEFIVRKGDPGQDMFVIQSGSVIVRSGNGADVVIEDSRKTGSANGVARPDPTFHDGGKQLGVDWLRHVIVHADGEAALAV